MDKETLSNYGWITICVLVIAVMVALATPFGSFIKTAVENTTQGLYDTSAGAINSTELMHIAGQSFGEDSGETGNEPAEPQGQQYSNTVIDANEQTGDYYTEVTINSCEVRNVMIDNSTINDSNCDNVTLDNCDINGSTFDNASLSNCTISNTTFVNNISAGNCVFTGTCSISGDNTIIYSCTFNGNITVSGGSFDVNPVDLGCTIASGFTVIEISNGNQIIYKVTTT